MKFFKKESLFLYIILDFFVIPLLIYLYLSIPRIYASFSFSNWSDQFTSSYINSNITFSCARASFFGTFQEIVMYWYESGRSGGIMPSSPVSLPDSSLTALIWFYFWKHRFFSQIRDSHFWSIYFLLRGRGCTSVDKL